MNARTRSIHAVWVLVAGLIIGPATGRSARAEGDTASPATEVMCPNGASLAEIQARYDQMAAQKEELEKALKRADGDVQFINQVMADQAKAMQVWGMFDATSRGFQGFVAFVDLLHMAARGFQDAASVVSSKQTVTNISSASTVAEAWLGDEVAKATGSQYGTRSTNCVLPNRAKHAIDAAQAAAAFSQKPAAKYARGISGLKNAGVSACKMHENLEVGAELAYNNDSLALLKRELARYTAAANAVRAQLSTLAAKRAGMEKQCIAHTENQKRLQDFAKADSALSKGINEARDESASQQRSDSANALGDMVNKLQDAQPDLTQMATQQQRKPRVVYVPPPTGFPMSTGSSSRDTSTSSGPTAPRCVSTATRTCQVH